MAINTSKEVEDAEEYIRAAMRVLGNIADSASPRSVECRVALDEIIQIFKKLNIEAEIHQYAEEYFLAGGVE
jgi:phosphoribosylanthranilate isomerase